MSRWAGCIVLASLAGAAAARGGEPASAMGGALLALGAGTRSLAMGEAASALVGDESIAWNPAGSAFGRSCLRVSHGQLPAANRWEELSGQVSIGRGNAAFSVGALLAPGVERIDANGAAAGGVARTSETLARAGYGARLNATLAAGVSLGLLAVSAGEGRTTAFSASAGGLWSPSRALRVGLYGSSVGTAFASRSLPIAIAAGAAWSGLSDRLTAAVDGRFVANGGVSAGAGVEYAPIEAVCVRFGWRAGGTTRALGGLAGLRAGIAVRLPAGGSKIDAEYALVHAGLLGLDHRIALRWTPPTAPARGARPTLSALPAPPRVATSAESGGVRLRWDPVAGAAGYNVYASEPGSPPKRVNGSPWTKTDLLVRGAEKRSVEFRVAAVDPSGREGQRSQEVAHAPELGEVRLGEAPEATPAAVPTGPSPDEMAAAAATAIAKLNPGGPSVPEATPTRAPSGMDEIVSAAATAIAQMGETDSGRAKPAATAKPTGRATAPVTDAKPLGMPVAPTASVSGRELTLTWNAVPRAAGYHVYLNSALSSTSRPTWVRMTFRPVSGTAYRVTLDAAGTYRYALTALDAAGTETYKSAQVEVKVR